MDLIQLILGMIRIDPLHDTSRYTNNRAAGRYILKHHAAGSDLTVITNRTGTKYLGSGSDHDITAKRRVTLSLFLSGSAKGHPLI